MMVTVPKRKPRSASSIWRSCHLLSSPGPVDSGSAVDIFPVITSLLASASDGIVRQKDPRPPGREIDGLTRPQFEFRVAFQTDLGMDRSAKVRSEELDASNRPGGVHMNHAG